MKKSVGPGTRLSRRFPSNMQFRGWASNSKLVRAVCGQIDDISRGGVSVRSSRSLPNFSLVRCEISVSPTATAIPTLMQVRWNKKTASGKEQKIGLQFVV